jgi:hypothetical protein
LISVAALRRRRYREPSAEALYAITARQASGIARQDFGFVSQSPSRAPTVGHAGLAVSQCQPPYRRVKRAEKSAFIRSEPARICAPAAER